MLDPRTFGDAPAALYLVELLKQRENPNLNRKVARTLATQRETLNELGKAHLEYDTISVRTFGRLLQMLSLHNEKSVEPLKKIDPFIAHIVLNVLEGGVKTWKRRVHAANRKKGNIARNTPEGMTVEQPIAFPLDQEKDSAQLQARSKRYLERKGKQDTLY